MLEKSINAENINTFVLSFYTKVMEDEKIGHFFTDILGDDLNNKQWQAHIEILCDFWESMTCGGSSYRGSPFAPHVKLMGLTQESFETWLRIFFETLDEIYEVDVSVPFKEAGSIMAQNFMRNLRI